jgi:hypothetical protein
MTDLSTKCYPLPAVACTSDQYLSRQMPIGKNPMAERCRRPPLSVSSNSRSHLNQFLVNVVRKNAQTLDL